MSRQNRFDDNPKCRCNDNSSENNYRANNCHVINEHNCGCTVCPQRPIGPRGLVGPQGPIGETVPVGPQGPAGTVFGYADFYALMPPDNATAVAPGTQQL